MSRFLEALHSGRVLLMDGAMGTELQRAGSRPGECYEEWNVTHREEVQAIHRSYEAAGAEVALTNTFQANAFALGRRGLGGKTTEFCAWAVTNARTACLPKGFVLGSIGPFVDAYPILGLTDPFVFRQIGTGLANADGVLFETWSDSDSLSLPAFVQRSDPVMASKPLLLSLSYRRTGDALATVGKNEACRPPEWFAKRAKDHGFSALGVNCGRDVGMDEVIEIVRRYRSETDLPLFARPNAGTPTRDGDRWLYPLTPEQMAARLPELLEAGVSMVGGCCGTTPEHIAAFRPIIAAWNARSAASASLPRERGE